MAILQAEPISAAQIPLLRRRLLAWYRRHRRDLDWRRTRDPYRIWLSEIMLQQTRVAAVIPYYRRFLEKFPTVTHLARAPLDAVLEQWAGLGYYSRARNLQRAAHQIVAEHGGDFPPHLRGALALPGVGSYTAAAVLSIAYQKPLAVLDGNVARVLARWGAIRGDLRAPHIWHQLENTAGEMLARRSPGDWNQAMMELGATVCTPRTPRCTTCPVAKWCLARALEIEDQVPEARRKAAGVRLTLAAAVLLDPRGRTLLLRHDSEAGTLFSRLWQFPAVEVDRTVASRQLAAYLQRTLQVTPATLEPLATSKHAVTFRDIRLVPFLVRVKELPPVPGSRKPRLANLGNLPISSATRKISRAALAAPP